MRWLSRAARAIQTASRGPVNSPNVRQGGIPAIDLAHLTGTGKQGYASGHRKPNGTTLRASCRP